MKPRSDPTFDQRLADWLEADPSTAPRGVLDTVLAAFPSIDQRQPSRVPWRLPLMNRTLLPAAAALIVAVGGALLLLGPMSNLGPAGPSATAIPTPAVSSTEPSIPATPDRPALDGTACGLVAASEVSAAGGYDGLRATESEPGPVGQLMCRFSTDAGDIVLGLTHYRSGGRAEFDAVKGGPSAQPVAGIGDEAVWNADMNRLDFRIGDALVRIMVREGGRPNVSAFDFVRSVGQLVAQRL